MRPDMSKVIVERQRRGGGEAKPGRKRKIDEETDLPDKEGIRRPHMKGWNMKELNENLSPLYRFLDSRVGKLWNKVHSEISESISLDNAVQKHVLDHLKQMVHKNCRFDLRGRPLVLRNRYGAERGWELLEESVYSSYNPYYVDKHGALRKCPVARKKERKPNPDLRVVSKVHEYRRVKGVWWEVFLNETPEGGAYDQIEKRVVMPSDNRYRPRMYVVVKRQLGTKEIRDLKLNKEQ